MIKLWSIGRINALSPKTHAHRAIVATVFHPDHTGILPESISLLWKFSLFSPFLHQFMPPGQPRPCCIYAMQQHWYGLSGNASLNQPNRLDCGGARLSGNRNAALLHINVEQGFLIVTISFVRPTRARYLCMQTVSPKSSARSIPKCFSISYCIIGLEWCDFWWSCEQLSSDNRWINNLVSLVDLITQSKDKELALVGLPPIQTTRL
jgi:hypothetical protein